MAFGSGGYVQVGYDNFPGYTAPIAFSQWSDGNNYYTAYGSSVNETRLYTVELINGVWYMRAGSETIDYAQMDWTSSTHEVYAEIHDPADYFVGGATNPVSVTSTQNLTTSGWVTASLTKDQDPYLNAGKVSMTSSNSFQMWDARR